MYYHQKEVDEIGTHVQVVMFVSGEVGNRFAEPFLSGVSNFGANNRAIPLGSMYLHIFTEDLPNGLPDLPNLGYKL